MAAPGLNLEKDYLLQIFADDASAAIKGTEVTEVMEMAARLGEILQRTLQAIGLALSQRKCKNFISSEKFEKFQCSVCVNFQVAK